MNPFTQIFQTCLMNLNHFKNQDLGYLNSLITVILQCSYPILPIISLSFQHYQEPIIIMLNNLIFLFPIELAIISSC
jgi:hypothetical protein